MASKLSVNDVMSTIEQLYPEEQKQLLSKLLDLLNITHEDLALLRVAESSFDFWDNPEDSVYDTL